MEMDLGRLAHKRTEQFFNGDFLEPLGNKYVAWVDIMGVRDALQNNQKAPAIWRAELLSVVHEYIDDEKVEVFTVGDGVVIMTDREKYLTSFLGALFTHYVNFNLNRYGDWEIYLHRLIRAGVGSGQVYRINVEAYDTEKDEGAPFPDGFSNTPFGPGPIEAFNAEQGSPFSIQEADGDNGGTPVKWWDDTGLSKQKRYELLELLAEYFQWFNQRDYYSYEPYESEHDKKAKEYFNASNWSIDMNP